MSHKFGARRRLEQTTKANNGRYRAGRQRLPYQWLGVGAVALGIGAAFSSGSGIAHAQGADANSSHSPSAGGRPATGVPTNAHGPTDNGSLGSLRRSHDNVMSRRHAAPTTTLSSSGGHPGGTTAGPSGGSFRTGAALPVRAKLVLRFPQPRSSRTALLPQRYWTPRSRIRSTRPRSARLLPHGRPGGTGQVFRGPQNQTQRPAVIAPEMALPTTTTRAATTPSAEVMAAAAPAVSVNPIVNLLAGVLSFFGFNTPTAPSNPLAALGVANGSPRRSGLRADPVEWNSHSEYPRAVHRCRHRVTRNPLNPLVYQ